MAYISPQRGFYLPSAAFIPSFFRSGLTVIKARGFYLPMARLLFPQGYGGSGGESRDVLSQTIEAAGLLIAHLLRAR